jgi:hypothetical protein
MVLFRHLITSIPQGKFPVVLKQTLFLPGALSAVDYTAEILLNLAAYRFLNL